VPIRGNVETRIELARGGSVDAVVLAAAGLRRLGYLDADATDRGAQEGDTVVRNLQAQILDHQMMLPAPGQGALALEVHSSLEPWSRNHLASLDDVIARAESQAERGFLGTLAAGCTSPVGALGVVKSVRGTSLDLTLAAVIGRTLLSNLSEPTKTGPAVGPSGVLRWEAHGSTDDPAQFGASQAIEVLSELRDPQGPRR
jgi:hydroxymethylbilane synthase